MRSRYRRCRSATNFFPAFVLLIFAGNSAVAAVIDSSDLLQTAVHENRETGLSRLDSDSVSEFLYPYSSLLDDETLRLLDYNGKSPMDPYSQMLFLRGRVARDEALEDIDLLMAAFRHSYCLFEYFGGVDTFEAARNRMIEDIARVSAGTGTVRRRALREIIVSNLDFVQDGHAFVAAERLMDRHAFYFNDRLEFSRDRGGYYTELRGERHYLDAVNGTAPEHFMKLSVSADGSLVFIVGEIRPADTASIPARLTLRNGETTQSRTVHLRRKSEISFFSTVTYRFHERRGVPVLVNRNSAPSTQRMQDQMDDFLESAREFRGEDVIILDLRNHAGGQAQPLHQWTQTLVGQPVSYEQHEASLRTRTALTLQRDFVEWYLGGNEERRVASMASIERQLDALAHYDAETDTVWTTRHLLDNQPELLPNRTPVFVLVDRETGSAGEWFVNFLRQIENVVFVGENTEGLITSGTPVWGSLPHSGLSFQFPIDLAMSGLEAGAEGVGFEPDIWLDPDKALRRVVRMLERQSAN